MGGARHYETEEVSSIDFRIGDPRIVFATEAKASSAWSSSYAARTATGTPSIFPKGGDEYGSWLAESGDPDPWIDLEFPETETVAIAVFETCGPGALREVRDLESDTVLWSGAPKPLSASRRARLFVITLDRPRRLSRLRLRVAGYALGSEYKEIDAVALLTVPLEALATDPPSWGETRHERFAPSDIRIHDLLRDRRIHWAVRAKASSVYSSSYAAKEATGRPKVFPKAGDEYKTWLAEDEETEEWLELTFPEHSRTAAVLVFETCCPGAVYRITDGDEVLWHAPPESPPKREARMLHVALDAPGMHRRLRLWLAPKDDYRQIDAVAVSEVPLEKLAEEAPPKGTPDEGWDRLEGVLEGVALQVGLATEDEAATRNAGSPALRFDDGERVTLELADTTLYGAQTELTRGTWAEVKAKAPDAARPFHPGPADDARALLRTRRIASGTRVTVIGEITEEAHMGGFRDSARAPARLRATAIAAGESRPLDDHAPAAFRRFARRLEKRDTARHPLSRMVAWFGGFAVAGAAVSLGLLAGQGVAQGGRWALFAGAFAYGFGGLAIELNARRCFVPSILSSPASRVSDRRVSHSTGFSIVVLTAMLGSVWTLVLGLLTATAEAPLIASVIAELVAIPVTVRTVLWLWTQSRPTLEASRLLRRAKRSGHDGVLLRGPFERVEVYHHESKYLGTYTSTDEDGNTVTHDRYRYWYERHVRASGPDEVVLELTDGRVVRTPAAGLRTLHAAIRPTKVEGGSTAFAAYRSDHEDGEPATLIGELEQTPEGWRLAEGDRAIVLGERRAIRRRVRVQWASALVLVLMVLAAVAAVTITATAFD